MLFRSRRPRRRRIFSWRCEPQEEFGEEGWRQKEERRPEERKPEEWWRCQEEIVIEKEVVRASQRGWRSEEKVFFARRRQKEIK